MLGELLFENIGQYVRINKLRKKYSGSRIDTPYVNETVSLGSHVYIAANCKIKGEVEIGDYSYCSERTYIFKGCKIGKYCSIGYNVQIGCPEHPLHFLSTSPTVYRAEHIRRYCDWPEDDIKAPVRIGNDVWVGSNSIILQGVTVGDGAVIAAGAVVNHDVPPFSIWGGVPAKCIGKRFEHDLEDKIANSEWWNHDIEWINKFTDKLYQAEGK